MSLLRSVFGTPLGVPRSVKKASHLVRWLDFSVLAGIRTLDPLIKSQLLYQLSYEDVFRRQKYKNLPYFHLCFRLLKELFLFFIVII